MLHRAEHLVADPGHAAACFAKATQARRQLRCLPAVALAKAGALFGQPERPAVCVSLRPTEAMCHSTRDEALEYLTGLELATGP